MTPRHQNKLKLQSLAPKKLCECGCREFIPSITVDGKPMRFKNGHQNKGNNNGSWKNGEVKTSEYYYKTWIPNHPNKDISGYVRNHRLIYEHYLKILMDEDVYIPKGYDVHHIIPVKEGGTNALINLQLLTKQEHTRITNSKDKSDRLCYICGEKTRVDKKGYEYWNRHPITKLKWLCDKCYNRELINVNLQQSNY